MTYPLASGGNLVTTFPLLAPGSSMYFPSAFIFVWTRIRMNTIIQEGKQTMQWAPQLQALFWTRRPVVWYRLNHSLPDLQNMFTRIRYRIKKARFVSRLLYHMLQKQHCQLCPASDKFQMENPKTFWRLPGLYTPCTVCMFQDTAPAHQKVKPFFYAPRTNRSSRGLTLPCEQSPLGPQAEEALLAG